MPIMRPNILQGTQTILFSDKIVSNKNKSSTDNISNDLFLVIKNHFVNKLSIILFFNLLVIYISPYKFI